MQCFPGRDHKARAGKGVGVEARDAKQKREKRERERKEETEGAREPVSFIERISTLQFAAESAINRFELQWTCSDMQWTCNDEQTAANTCL